MGDKIQVCQGKYSPYFNTRPFAWATTVYVYFLQRPAINFDPRPAARGATKRWIFEISSTNFSIHAPPQGGGGINMSIVSLDEDIFQSTPRHKGATAVYCPYTAPHPTSTQSTLCSPPYRIKPLQLYHVISASALGFYARFRFASVNPHSYYDTRYARIHNYFITAPCIHHLRHFPLSTFIPTTMPANNI